MSIELKHGDSGHSQLISIRRGLKGEDIINHIGNMYKISPKDQLIITKQGHIVEPHQPMDSGRSEQACNKTLSTGFKNQSKFEKYENSRSFCLFLFNLKQLNKPDQNHQEKSKSYWIDELKEKLINFNSQNSTVFPYDSLDQSYHEEELQKYERFVLKINSLRESYKKLANEYSDMKEYSYKIEQTTERCANQKKASSILTRAIKTEFDHLSSKIKDIAILKESFKSKIVIDDKSLRENSSCFQNRKKNQNSVSLYENQIKNLKQAYQKFAAKLKEEMKKVKLAFRNVQEKILEFTGKKHISKLQQCHRLNKKDYDQILSLFGQLIQSGSSCESKYGVVLETKILRSSQNVSNVLLNQFSQICEELTNYYCEFNQLNEQNKNKIKNILGWYNTAVGEIRGLFKSALSIEKTIGIEIEQQNKRKASIINKKLDESIGQISESQIIVDNSSASESSQIQRRIRFKKMLNSIHSLASKLCYEQETLRKRYVSELKGFQKLEYECLKNTKVPQIDFEDSGSSDLELIKAYKSSGSIQVKQSEISSEEFMIINFNLVMEKIKALNHTNETSRVKNLQEILKKTSDIFSKVYNKKINDLITQKQLVSSKIPVFQQKITSLQFQIEALRCQAKELSIKISEKEEKLIARQRQRSQQINKERSKYQKLLAQFKSLEKSLSKQTKVNEQLYNQFVKNQDQLKDSIQLNQYLKELLAQKELQVTEIQKRMNELEKQEKQPTKDIQSDLKSAVFHNFSKDITSNSQKDAEIQRLKQDITMLQKQNEELLEQIQQISAEMRKLLKQTQDIEVQVNLEEPVSKLLPSDCVTINQQISVGQNALFMPFSNAIYVGVNYKDEDKTICNMNNVHYNNYFLDLSCFNSKTKELLTQCSFLIVLHVTNVEKDGGRMMVKGEIRYVFGFEDDNMGIKNYYPLLPH